MFKESYDDTDHGQIESTLNYPLSIFEYINIEADLKSGEKNGFKLIKKSNDGKFNMVIFIFESFDEYQKWEEVLASSVVQSNDVKEDYYFQQVLG